MGVAIREQASDSSRSQLRCKLCVTARS